MSASCCAALLLLHGFSGSATAASSAAVIVNVTLASSITLDVSGCASGAAGRTDFGLVIPGSPTPTTLDCTVVFGSTNNTSMLRLHQADQSSRAMWKYANGAPDPAFSGDGVAFVDVLAGTNVGQAVGHLSNGRIAAGGGNVGGAANDGGAAVFLATGALDPSFNGTGIVTVDFGGATDQTSSLATQSDDKVLIGGWTGAGVDDVSAARFTAAGALDPTFGTGGKATLNAGFDDETRSIEIGAGGKIVMGGNSNPAGNIDMLAVRLNADGSADTTFNGGGYATINAGGANSDVIRSITEAPDGKLVGVGWTFNGTNNDIGIARWNANGSTDLGFNGTGFRNIAVESGVDNGWEVAVQSDRKVLAVGEFANVPLGGDNDLVVIRLNEDGTPDGGFGTAGIARIRYNASSQVGRGIVVQLDGKIVIAGTTTNGAQNELIFARLTTAGALDATFGTAGYLVINPSAGNDSLFDVAIGQDGSIIAGGGYYNGVDDDFMAVKLTNNTTVADYGGGTTFASASAFGGCLRSIASATATWTVDADNSCSAVDSDPWNGIARQPASAGSKVASAAFGVNTATVNMRYGLKLAVTESIGDQFYAPLAFEVVAPNV